MRKWTIVFKDHTSAEVAAEDLQFDGSLVRFVNGVQVPKEGAQDVLVLAHGTWLRIEADNAAIEWHDAPAPAKSAGGGFA